MTDKSAESDVPASAAWITLLLIPTFMLLMSAVHREYIRIGGEIHSETPLNLTNLTPPLVIVPIRGWSKGEQESLAVRNGTVSRCDRLCKLKLHRAIARIFAESGSMG